MLPPSESFGLNIAAVCGTGRLEIFSDQFTLKYISILGRTGPT
jgi:hypothetical protein